MERTIITTHVFTGQWHTSTAPNGCTSSTERRLRTVTIFEADYYGRGAKKYAEGFTQLEFTHGGKSPRFDSWQDGHLDRIAEIETKIEADRTREVSQ